MSPSVSKDEKLPGLFIFSSVKFGIFSSCNFIIVFNFPLLFRVRNLYSLLISLY